MKWIIVYGCLFMASLSFSSCLNLSAPIPASILRESFDALDNLDPGLWHFEVASTERVSFDPLHKIEGDASLRLTVQPGDMVNKGTRAEIVLKNSDPLHQEAWYRWSFMIPVNYADSTEAKWEVLAQWHDQPEDGDWSDYPGHSPMIGLYYGKDEAGNNGFVFQYGRSASGYEGYQTIGPYYITKGKWYTITAHVFWSLHANGFAEFWASDGECNTKLCQMGTDITLITGPNMFNKAPAYLKLGIYRNPEIGSINEIYLDAFSRGGKESEL